MSARSIEHKSLKIKKETNVHKNNKRMMNSNDLINIKVQSSTISKTTKQYSKTSDIGKASTCIEVWKDKKDLN